MIKKSLADLPRPLPAAGIDSYTHERERALAYSNKRRKNYERFQSLSRRSADVDYLPIKLDIENISRCNYRCTMCTVSDWHKGRRAKDMSLIEFTRLVDEQYGLVEIKLQGIGEPSIQGDVFFEMIKYARAQHIWVRTTTNASLLNVRNNYKKYIDSDTNEIQISIDGSDKKTFEMIRRGSRFEKVCDNCKLINDYSRERSVIRTKMWTVVQRSNQHQLEELVELASELGFTNQVFALDMHGWSSPEWEKRNKAEGVEDIINVDRLSDLVELGAKRGVIVAFWTIAEKYSINSLDKRCMWPFERAVVSSDLRTVPCCMIGNPDTFELAPGVNFTEAWKSNDYSGFRKAHLDGNIPSVCKGCYYDS